MNQEYILRDSCADDATTIVSWFANEQEALNWGGPLTSFPVTAAWLAEEFLDPLRSYYTLIDAEGEVTGTYFLYHMPDENRLHIGRFAVSPAWRRRGLATRMIELAKQNARAIGVSALTLNVYEHNGGARKLYEGAGFYVPADAVIESDRGGRVIPMRFDISNRDGANNSIAS